jgi:hypothetical protein
MTSQTIGQRKESIRRHFSTYVVAASMAAVAIAPAYLWGWNQLTSHKDRLTNIEADLRSQGN